MEQSHENDDNHHERAEAESAIFNERLPCEVFSDILSRLHISSLMQCKLVSRFWYSSVNHPRSISTHLLRASEKNLFVLCFSDYPTSKLDVIDLSSCENNNRLVAKPLNFPDELTLTNFDVIGSCNGLLCLVDRSCNDPLFIYNPFTREYRVLPELINPCDLKVFRVVFGFGFHPRTKEYKAIKLVYHVEGQNVFTGTIKEPEVYVLTLGNSKWRHIGKKPYRISCMASDTLLNGNLHWLTPSYSMVDGEKHRDIIAFDLASEEFRVITLPSGLGANKATSHVVVLHNRLSALVQCKTGENEIWTLKDYSASDSWTREFVIPRYVPQGYIIDCVPPCRIRLNRTRSLSFRVLCTLKSEENQKQILFLYRDRLLVLFNMESGEFKHFATHGLPIEIETVVHVGSLISVDSAFTYNPCS